MVSHKHKCIFVHIPRTGGTSIEHAFGVYHDKPSPALVYKKHHTPQECMDELGAEVWNNYFKFTFIRDPWERMVSWWAYKTQLFANPEKVVTLEDVLALGEHSHVFGGHDIWLKGCEYDFIGRHETLDEDFREVCRLLEVRLELPWELRTTHGRYCQYYTEETRAWVERREADFIAQFCYEFEN